MAHDEQLPECKDFKTRVDGFMVESTGRGGTRERLIIVEHDIVNLKAEIAVIKKDVLKGAIIGGIIGALIGSGAAPAVTGIVNMILRIG